MSLIFTIHLSVMSKSEPFFCDSELVLFCGSSDIDSGNSLAAAKGHIGFRYTIRTEHSFFKKPFYFPNFHDCRLKSVHKKK